MDHAFFGRDKHLFGSFHPAPGDPSARAVLMAAPLLGENLRSHWTLSRTAEALAQAGCSVLRFDFSANGHSGGSLADLDVETWLSDCHDALIELQDLTGCRSVVTLGVRFSAALLAAAMPQMGTSILRSVCWDPIWSGSTWLDELKAMSCSPGQSTELAGHVVSSELIASISTISIDEATIADSQPVLTQNAVPDSPASARSLDLDCQWGVLDLQMILGHELITTLTETCTQ